MSYILHNDQELLAESYKSINMKQVILESSVGNLRARITTLAEAYAILDIYDDVVEEGIFDSIKGGLSNLGRGGMQTGRIAGRALAQGAKTAGRMAGAAGRQVGQNVSQIARTGATARETQLVIKQAQEAATRLTALIDQARQLSPETFQDSRGRSVAANVENLSLKKLLYYLTQAGDKTQRGATSASERGYFAGIGGAMGRAYDDE